ncbi:hypothetical protein F1880_010254, partial [Penicillium rolfsii]
LFNLNGRETLTSTPNVNLLRPAIPPIILETLKRLIKHPEFRALLKIARLTPYFPKILTTTTEPYYKQSLEAYI